MEEYDVWNEDKKQLAKISKRFMFKVGEIWWCSVGLNIGTEVRGKGDKFRRPILILKKLSYDSCVGLPLTTQPKKGSWYLEVCIPEGRRWIMLHQIKMVHVKRFQKKLSQISQEDFQKTKEKLGQLLELLDHHPAVAGIDGMAPQNVP